MEILTDLGLGYLSVNKYLTISEYNETFEMVTQLHCKKKKSLKSLNFPENFINKVQETFEKNVQMSVYDDDFILYKFIPKKYTVVCVVKNLKQCELSLEKTRHKIKNKLNRLLLEVKDQSVILDISKDVNSINTEELKESLFSNKI